MQIGDGGKWEMYVYRRGRFMGQEVKWESKVYGRCMYMGEGGV